MCCAGWGGGGQEYDIQPCKFYTSHIVCHSPKAPTPEGRERDVKEGNQIKTEQGEEIVGREEDGKGKSLWHLPMS